MNVHEAIAARRSIRNYLDKPIEEDKLMRILEAARKAPSSKNRQEWRFCVVRDKAARQRLMAAAKTQSFVAEAPVVIAVCSADTTSRMGCGHIAYPVDVAIAVDHLTLAAVEEGLGTCWLGTFIEDQVKEVLGIPASVCVVQLLTLGYPESIPAPTPRKTLAEIVRFEKWA